MFSDCFGRSTFTRDNNKPEKKKNYGFGSDYGYDNNNYFYNDNDNYYYNYNVNEEVPNCEINTDLTSINPKGIINLENCCYMNAFLQCFFHVADFTTNFIDEYQQFKSLQNSEFSNAYYSFIWNYIRSNRKYINPKKFKKVLENENEIFKKPTGHDSKDVLITTFYNLERELSQRIENYQNNEIIDHKKEEDAYDECLNEFSKTLIGQCFNWIHKTVNTCDKCHVKYYDFTQENVMIFDVKNIYNKYENKDNKNRTKKEKRIDILDGFRYFIDQDKNDNSHKRNNIFYCYTCKEEKRGKIDHSMCSLPKTLVIILDNGEENNEFKCKINLKKQLDLSELEKKDKTYKIIDEKYIDDKRPIYDLIAFTISYRYHTVAVCRHFDNEYYLFNDRSVQKVSIEDFENDEIYLLFYTLRNS